MLSTTVLIQQIIDNGIFDDIDLKLITPLQLLRINTGTQMPFADRLLEYLTDSCITGGDAEVRENVLMAQILASYRYKGDTEIGDYCIKQVETVEGSTGTIQHKIVIVKPSAQDCTTIGDTYIKAVHHTSATPHVSPFCAPEYCSHVMRLDNLNPKSFTDLGPVKEVLPEFVTTKVRPEPLKFNLINGVWSPAMQKIFYNYMTNTAKTNFTSNHDLLGYVDKDAEKLYSSWKKENNDVYLSLSYLIGKEYKIL